MKKFHEYQISDNNLPHIFTHPSKIFIETDLKHHFDCPTFHLIKIPQYNSQGWHQPGIQLSEFWKVWTHKWPLLQNHPYHLAPPTTRPSHRTSLKVSSSCWLPREPSNLIFLSSAAKNYLLFRFVCLAHLLLRKSKENKSKN